MEKDYTKWFKLKPKLNRKKNIAEIKEDQIWWCNLGLNIGDEEDGKGESVSRPILIIKKFNRYLFWGVPLTTQIKSDEKNYHIISFHNRRQSVLLTHLGVRDTKRLTTKLGKLTAEQFNEVRGILKAML